LDTIEENYVKRLFNDEGCKRCPYLEIRFSEECQECPNHLGRFKLYKEVKIAGDDYYGVPYGNRARLKRVLPNFKTLKAKGLVTDKRPKTKLTEGWEFTAKARSYQKKSVEELIEAGYGVLQSPPRSGKTVMAAKLVVDLGYKTLILAHQDDLLDQFLTTFRGDADNKPMTNVKDIEKFQRRKLIGKCKTLADYNNYDVCLATYQQFLGKHGAKRLKHVKNLFPVIIVDEAHRGGATGYSSVLNNLNCRHRFGLTSTALRLLRSRKSSRVAAP
jgi:superfamily II DNA or RNA helicase